jgi:peptidoglycan/LPS O-acetylase OafA/YrhL
MERSATTSQSVVSRPRYRPDIDGLRAVAVAAVVAYHAHIPGASGGYAGVDIFFVISGFLITALLVEEIATDGHLKFAQFYARRARRLLPALTVVLVATLILGRVFFSVLGAQQTFAKSAIATVLFSSNFFFMRSTAGYFDPAAASQPLLHTWSLGVEEQFYLVWPLMVYVVALFARNSFAQFESRLRATLAFVFAASLALEVWLTWHQPAVAFYMMPPRAWEFAAGALVALNVRRLAKLSSRAASTLDAAGVIAIVVSIAAFDERTPFPGIAALVPIFGSVAVIAAGISRHRTPVMRILSSRVMVSIGLVSYPWYLWHWPFLVIARDTSLGHQSLVRDVGLSLVSLILAIVTRDWIERPFRRSSIPRPINPARTIVAAGVASGLVLAVALGVGYAAQADAAKPANRLLIEAKKDRPSSRSTCGIGRSPQLQPPSLCTVGDTTSARQIVLWGDSHAEHLMPLADIEGAALSVAILERSRSACPPLLGITPVSIHRVGSAIEGAAAARDCASFNDAVIDEFRRGNSSRATVGVIISARWPAYLGGDSPFEDNAVFDLGLVDSRSISKPSIELMTEGLNASLSALAALRLRVIVVAPTPFLPFSGPDCLATRRADQCRVSRREVERLRAPALDAVRSVVSRFTNARLWDPIDGLCAGEFCGAAKDSVVIYRDLGHLTSAAVRSLDSRARPLFVWLADSARRSAPDVSSRPHG